MTVKEAYEFLRDNQYILANGSEYVFSKKFYEELATKAVISVKSSIDMLPTLTTPRREFINWQLKFIGFIDKAQVPKRIETRTGEAYDCNKYSEPAMKEFRKIIEKEGINEEVLIKSTMLYYKSGSSYKKKIGNYIIDGDWRSDYLALLNAAQQGSKSIEEHIKTEIKTNEQHNPWSL